MGLFDFVGDILGTNNDYHANTPPIDTNTALVANSKIASNQYNTNLNQQQDFAKLLQAQMNGQGPNPAMDQLNQTTNQNVKSAAGLAGSQKGISPALAARYAAEAGTNANQQAVGQAATMRSNQILQDQNQLGGLYGQMANQNLQDENINITGNNAQNSGVNQAYLGQQGINAGVSAGNQQTNAGMVGGLINAGGGIMAQSAAPKTMSHGGPVPGKPKVSGDSETNDTVPAMLSPGEIVIKKTAAQDPDKAHEFLDHVMKESGKKEDSEPSYGEVLKAHRKLAEKVKHLEKRVGKRK